MFLGLHVIFLGFSVGYSCRKFNDHLVFILMSKRSLYFRPKVPEKNSGAYLPSIF